MRKVGGPVVAPAAAASIGSSAMTPFMNDDLGLNMYGGAPDTEVSVREFEEFSRDRLRTLHVIDRLCGYDAPLGGISALKPKLTKDLVDARLLLEYPSGVDEHTFESRKNDYIRRDSVSHFALRMACCKTRDARNWFLTQEQRLFTLRFDGLRPKAQEEFIKNSGLKCEKFEGPSAAQAITIQELQRATPAAKIWKQEGRPELDSTFYVMPFQEVDPRLIASRQVVIKAGRAYVPSVALKQILAKRFRESLSAKLDVAFQGLDTALSNPRIGGFLKSLQDYGLQLLVAKTSSQEHVGDELTLENFEELMVRSFPPCMRRVIEVQRETKKHLKHAGRLQLRPFLKDCGFKMDESFKWWKKEITQDPTVDGASFDKNYIYDVEHTYGKKGHLQGQNSFGCPKIIGFPAEAAGQCHGCTFKNLEGPALRHQMHRWKVPEPAVNEMEKLIKHGNHYQLACVEYFKAMHTSSEGDGVGNSPGDYFRESCRFYEKKKEQAAAAAAGAGAPPPTAAAAA